MTTTPAHAPRVGDGLLTVSLFVLLGVPSMVLAPGTQVAAIANLAAAIAMPAAMYWRRHHPMGVTAVVYLSALGHLVLGSPGLPVDVIVLLALYSATVHASRVASRWALVGALLGAALQTLTATQRTGPGLVEAAAIFLALAAVVVAVWALGHARRNRLRHVAALAEREQQLAVERAQQAQIVAAEERARIARDMHDVVAHSLSVVIAQADGGQYAARHDPQAAQRALSTIADTGRAALADMRKILGVLRTPEDESEAAPTAPQPLDNDIADLITQVRGAGLSVALTRLGTPRALPPGLGVTVYRICQEALTNVLKHAGSAVTASVLLQWGARRLILQVDDTGRGAAAGGDGGGHGLVGMQERVDLFGGTLQAGPRPGGGFRVRVELPIPAVPQLPDYPGDPAPNTAIGEAGVRDDVKAARTPEPAESYEISDNETQWEGPR